MNKDNFMKKFNNLVKSIISEMTGNKLKLSEDWNSNDEFNIKILSDPTLDSYDKVFYIVYKNESIQLLKRADYEEAIWMARNIIDELKDGIDFNTALNKWQEILLDQKSRSRW